MKLFSNALLSVLVVAAFMTIAGGCGSPHHVARRQAPLQSKEHLQAKSNASTGRPSIPSLKTEPSPMPAAAPVAPLDCSPHPAFSELAPQRASEDEPGDIVRAKDVTDAVALTFDAGAESAPASSILDTLKSENLHATFFLTGKWCEDNPELVKRIVAEGNEVGNHSYSHPDLRHLSDQEIAEQFRRMNRLFNEITGGSCIGFMRPPYGGLDKRVISVAAKEGYGSVRWSVDSWDAWKKGITGQEIQDRVLHRVKPGDIVLMHCGSKPTADVLPDLVTKLRQRGLRMVTVSELVGAKKNPEDTQAE